MAKRTRFTQVSLFSVLLSGRYDGVIAVGELKKLGNMAIATMDRLDGEMQMVDGVLHVKVRAVARQERDGVGLADAAKNETVFECCDVRGEPLIEKGADALNKLAVKIDTGRMKPPAFKMVLTAVGDYASTRKDGVIVCPIGALKP